jgi:hypothetical protein
MAQLPLLCNRYTYTSCSKCTNSRYQYNDHLTASVFELRDARMYWTTLLQQSVRYVPSMHSNRLQQYTRSGCGMCTRWASLYYYTCMHTRSECFVLYAYLQTCASTVQEQPSTVGIERG